MRELTIFCDGASRGNPGPAALGAVILDSSDETVKELSVFLGIATNNEAEYHGLIAALKEAALLGASCIQVFMDSELVVRQLTGRYKVRTPHLVPLNREAQALLKGFERYTIAHIPRVENRRADALANQALDKAKGSKS